MGNIFLHTIFKNITIDLIKMTSMKIQRYCLTDFRWERLINKQKIIEIYCNQIQNQFKTAFKYFYLNKIISMHINLILWENRASKNFLKIHFSPPLAIFSTVSTTAFNVGNSSVSIIFGWTFCVLRTLGGT
ncbi:hypothetical protein BpHYR1_014150 [Brachionus plicatilis]|uniref:Uncharacterized protein n=1 Tax=Brachionus plicatilis TaxID=10195 RepID=A0A3M7Q805_BRAPC|nr:hypothetical protein BpHYR1_014150 [Brachionus plicatilis]